VTGTSAAISARTGNTAVPDGSWSAFTNIASSGSTLGLSGRYIQYRAALSTSSNAVTPVLESISFACSSSAPSGQSIQVQPVQIVATATLVPTFTPAPTETVAPTETPIDVPTVEAPTAVPTDVPTAEAPTDVPVTPTDVPTATLAPTEIPPAAAPTAAFTVSVDNGTAPLAVQFVNGSAGEINGYAWSFGDGGSSLDANPSYTFAVPGVYTVTLTVSGPGGAASAQTVITVS
jgi:PKD repeat protein